MLNRRELLKNIGYGTALAGIPGLSLANTDGDAPSKI